MKWPYVNIHTHCPTGSGIELRAVGIHPWDADNEAVESLIGRLAGAQAIGEIGLDAVRGAAPQRQMEQFRAQLQLACERALPVVLHCVRAFEAVMRELSLREPRAVIFHGFIGSPQQAQQALKKGYYLSFGERTFRSSKSLAALRITPLSHLFIETDDSATSIGEVYAGIAQARDTDLETLKRAVYENYTRIFGTENG